MTDISALYGYLLLVIATVVALVASTAIFPSHKGEKAKFIPYESGIQTRTRLMQERFPLSHYLVALLFLIFDVEVVFLYPWAVVAKALGTFAFYEMFFFVVALFVGFIYAWRKGGLSWD